MPKCPGMGEIVEDMEEEYAREVLLFCMENEICPSQLIHLKEWCAAWTNLSYDAKVYVQQLVDKMKAAEAAPMLSIQSVKGPKVNPATAKISGTPIIPKKAATRKARK